MMSIVCMYTLLSCFFFFNDTATTEIYTLSLHDALPIYNAGMYERATGAEVLAYLGRVLDERLLPTGRVRFRGLHEIGRAHVLNSSHANISYAVFCLKKKKQIA